MAEKQRFLLDENVVARCWTGMPAAIEIWTLILNKCYPLVLRNDLAQKYYEVKDKVKDAAQRFNPTSLINMTLRQADKAEWREDAPSVAPGPVRHQADHYLLEIAAHGGAFLVTTDAQTRDDFNSLLQANRFNVRGFTIEEALDWLRNNEP